MKRSGSQRVLLILSILSVIGAIIWVLAAAFGFFGSGVISSLDPTEAESLVSEAGISQGEASGLLLGIGIGGLLSALVSLIEGILGIIASKDATKIGPVRFLIICQLVLTVAGIALDLFSGSKQFTELGGAFTGLILNLFMLWICNNIKSQAAAQA